MTATSGRPEPQPGPYVHRCGSGHEWSAETYVDTCPTCRKQTFDVVKR